MALSVVLAGGGTGGHVYPALALAETIRKREPEARVRFLGTERGIETRVVRRAGYSLDHVPARPVRGTSPIARGRALLSLAAGFLAARRLLRSAGPDLVIGTGGYASVPAVLAALSLGVPVGLIEPNAIPGRANRWLARFVRCVFVQFQAALDRLPRGRAALTGIPVRPLPLRTPRETRGETGTVRLLVIGGSQGAHSINRAMCGALEQLGERDGFRITHQTGEADLADVRAAYAEAGVEAEISAFFDDMMERLSRAHLVLARAGASTIAELCIAGVASILVPYPHAADDHQAANAEALEQTGACRLLDDRQLERGLAPLVRSLARDPEGLRRMGDAALRLAAPDAAERIWDVCTGWLPATRASERR
ncbi:MAG: undecaprenyldiphospho-muramoylpentapeptide beta-N-acetylglucosaminyltransferase [Myxococcota bacterium]